MATIKKSAKKYAIGGTVTTETTKPVKKTFKTNPDSGGVAPFTAKEQTERRKKLGLPTSKSEEKAYYAKMSKEGARNGKSIKKAANGTTTTQTSIKPTYGNLKGDNLTKQDSGKYLQGYTDRKEGRNTLLPGKYKKQGYNEAKQEEKPSSPKLIRPGRKAKSGAKMKTCKGGC